MDRNQEEGNNMPVNRNQTLVNGYLILDCRKQDKRYELQSVKQKDRSFSKYKNRQRKIDFLRASWLKYKPHNKV